MSEILFGAPHSWSLAGWLFGHTDQSDAEPNPNAPRADLSRRSELSRLAESRHAAAFISRLRDGDTDAFEDCVRTYGDRLIRYAARWAGSVDRAREIVQDVFLAMWRDRAALPVTRDLAAYLFWRVRNHAMHTASADRATHAREGRWVVEHGVEAEQDATDGEIAVMALETRATILSALSAVPPRSRDVFMLVWDQHRSYADVAAILGIAIPSVRSHMSRALKHLLAVLGTDREARPPK